MNELTHSNRRYNRCNSKKPKKKDRMEAEEVAINYKLQQFLEDVQKFNERSKNNKVKKISKKKTESTSNHVTLKRGLFENGFRSRSCLKAYRARLKSNLNDLVKECPKANENDSEIISSSEESSLEGSYHVDKQEYGHNNNEQPENKEAAINRKDLVNNSHIPPKSINGCGLNIEDRNELKELVWEQFQRHMKDAVPSFKFESVKEHMELARKKINEMIYQAFLEDARNYPSILKRIFSNNEIRRLAQMSINDKVDKCEQTEDLKYCGSWADSSPDRVRVNQTFSAHFSLPNLHESSNQQGSSFFELMPKKESNTQALFLDSLSNQPQMFSPTPERNAILPPSPVQQDFHLSPWVPSSASTLHRPEVISSNSTSQSSGFNWDITPMSQREFPEVSRPTKIKFDLRNMQSIFEEQSQISQSDSPETPLHIYFPKRKRVTFSPHRL